MLRIPARTGTIAFGGLAMLAASACQPDTAPIKEQNNTEGAEAAPASPSPSVVAEQPLDRSAVLLAAAKAGSAAALGMDDIAQQRALDGKTFEVRIRFGCAASGVAGGARPGPFNVRFNSNDRTLRVRAAPDLTRETPQVKIDGIEYVEGFWMRRPWLLTPGCPSTALSGDERALAGSDQRVGIAQLSTAEDSRMGRRDGKAYEATKILEEGTLPSKQGYDLVLSGRLKRFPDGRVIICRLLGADTPPECVISAQFDHVRIQTPDGQTTLGDWRR